MTGEAGIEQALGWIRLLSEEIGPRRPTSPAERLAAKRMRDELAEAGLDARLEAFRGYPTFATLYVPLLAASLLGSFLPRRLRLSRALLPAAALAGAAVEGGLVRSPLSDRLSRQPSQNLVATIEPGGRATRTVCLVCHLDSSRSGLMFNPGLVAYLRSWIQVQSAALAANAAAPVISRLPGGRLVLRAARVVLAAGLGLLAERELRGVDVPGANDNASGVAVAARLAVECAAAPLDSTRVVLLMTGCEESGLIGAMTFLGARDTSDWLFLNFDGVGGAATLRYLLMEGVTQTWPADERLASVAQSIATDRPELGIEPARTSAGLTYDVTPVLARGGRALTFSVQDRTIPNYHQPSDSFANIEPESVARALEAGREMLRRIDAGDAD